MFTINEYKTKIDTTDFRYYYRSLRTTFDDETCKQFLIIFGKPKMFIRIKLGNNLKKNINFK